MILQIRPTLALVPGVHPREYICMTYIRQGANGLTSNLPTESFPFKKRRGRLHERNRCRRCRATSPQVAAGEPGVRSGPRTWGTDLGTLGTLGTTWTKFAQLQGGVIIRVGFVQLVNNVHVAWRSLGSARFKVTYLAHHEIRGDAPRQMLWPSASCRPKGRKTRRPTL